MSDVPACEPPCPVAAGRMGLFCTCGNVTKRWEATVERLRGEGPNIAAPEVRTPTVEPNVPTAEFVRDLLSSDGQGRPGDEVRTGLGEALLTLDPDVRQDVRAALWTYADERLAVAAEAERRATLIPPDEFRARNLVTAERIARLWRETCHVR